MVGRGHELEQPKAAEYERIRHRRESFKCHSRTTKGLQLTLVTPVGLKRNKYWGNVQRIVTHPMQGGPVSHLSDDFLV